MRPGHHAADDGSFGRSAGMAAGRGALLLFVAVVLGVLLLNAADDTPSRVGAGRDNGDSDGDRQDGVTTTTQPVPTTAAARPPRDVKVLSANGTEVAGAARKVSDGLRNLGYNVLAPGEARAAQASAVYFAPTFDREAQTVAQALQLPPTVVRPLPSPPPVSDIRGANVLVVVGPDLASKASQGSTTTTSRRGRTTTTARSRR